MVQGALKADKMYEIIKAENYNNNKHTGDYSWVVYIDQNRDKPHLFKTLGSACEWLGNFAEQEIR